MTMRRSSGTDDGTLQVPCERKSADGALPASERDLRLIVDSIPGMVAVFSAGGELQFVNNHTQEFYAATLEELKTWQAGGFTHPEDTARSVEAFTRSIASGEPFEMEVRARRFDGVYRWFQSRGKPLRDASGRIVCWCNLLTDIDDRKRAEEGLRRSEAFLAKGQTLSLTGTFSWEFTTGAFIWSEELYRIYEFEPGTHITFEKIATRYHPEDKAIIASVAEQARRGVRSFDYAHRLLMPNGSIKHIHVVAHGSHNRDGQLEYFGGVQDITERHIADEALNKARTELAHMARVTSLGALTASIAHEVNQPLSGIITNAGTCLRMLNADSPNIDGARETARRTIRDANRAVEIISRLRALFSNRKTSTEVVDLNAASQEVISLSLRELQDGRVALQTEFADDLPSVQGDRIQLQQVILNLIRNAAEAMSDVDDRPRELVIRTAKVESDGVSVAVQDSGLGVEPGNLGRVFDSFYTTKADGLGIGLSVCRTIIETHGGRLWATVGVPHGAIFQFTLPGAGRAANH
jgi:PAS domain S-box-containing protein